MLILRRGSLPLVVRLTLKSFDTLDNFDPVKTHLNAEVSLEISISNMVHDLPIDSNILYIK